MTVLGATTVLVIVVAWLLRRGAVQYVLAVAAVLPQTAGLIIADKGFPLFYLGVAVVAALAVPHVLMRIARPRAAEGPAGRTASDLVAVALVLWAGAITYAGPRIFAGLPVFDPSLGVDVQVGSLTPLAPTLGNAAQWGYLLIAVLFLLLGGRAFPVGGSIAGVAVWATILLAAARLAAGPAWPLDLLQNMPGYPYQNGDRLAGTFYEPSVLGMYLTAAAAYFGAQLLARGARRSLRSHVLPVAGLGLVAAEFVANGSGTALMGLVLVAAIGSAVVFARILGAGRMRLRPALIASSLAALAAALTQLPALYALTIGLVETKTESSSFVARGASNERSLGIVLDTFGLGVGLGGNRPSSFFLFVLSGVGVLGTALLLALVLLALKRGAASGRIAPVWALIGTLTAGAVAVPDLSTPLIWVCLAACLVGPPGTGLNPPVNPAPAPVVRTTGRRRAVPDPPTVATGHPLPEGIDMPRTPLRAPRHAPDVRIGCDVHTVRQTEESIALFGERYLHRVFTTGELAQCDGDVDRLAGRFAAKEAVLKVLRPDPEDAVPWSSIEVRNSPRGAPYVVLGGRARALAERRGVARVDVSLSHDAGIGLAVATAVCPPARDEAS